MESLGWACGRLGWRRPAFGVLYIEDTDGGSGFCRVQQSKLSTPALILVRWPVSCLQTILLLCVSLLHLLGLLLVPLFDLLSLRFACITSV